MRIRKAFLSSAMLATAGLLVAPAVTASEIIPTSCTTQFNDWTITLLSGPSVVSCGAPTGSCISATYEVEGAADHIVGLMPLGLFAVQEDGNQDFDPGEGDPIFGLGLGDVSRVAFKVNPDAATTEYTVLIELDGHSFDTGLVPVRFKKGRKRTLAEGACALAGPVRTGENILQTNTLSQDFEFDDCFFNATTDQQTDNTILVLTPDSIARGCTLDRIEAGDITVEVNGEGGALLFSEGFNIVVEGSHCKLQQYFPPSGPVYRICRR